jgi:hypothetical protein
MPVYHIGKLDAVSMKEPQSLTKLQVLFRLKPGVTPAQIATWKETCQGMVGKIPGK